MTIATPEKPAYPAVRQPMSYAAYLQQASETRIMEWVNGEVISYKPPSLRHQMLSRFLFSLLDAFVKASRLGEVLYAPFEVRLSPTGPSREPDIFFVRNAGLGTLTDERFEGAPDLVVEIVSPSSVREDRVRKFSEYERAGVAEYWLIDPRPRQETAEFFQLAETGIYQPAEIDADGVYHARVLPNFWLNVDWLWQDPLPDYQLALAEMMLANPNLPAELRRVYAALRDFLDTREP